GLGLCKIEFVIEKGSTRKFTRLSQAQTNVSPDFQTALQQHLQNNRTTVTLQLQHILAGIRVRRLEMDSQTAINHTAVSTYKINQGGMTCLQRLALSGTHSLDNGGNIFTGDANNADTTTPWCSSDGSDRGRIKIHGIDFIVIGIV